MKIGVLTFHNVNNYGSVLQTYATQETLRSLGHDPVIVDYCRADQVSYRARLKDACRRSSWYANPVLRMLYYLIKIPSYLRHKQVFEGFLKSHIAMTKKRYTSYAALCEDDLSLDAAITGSDQMWNSEYNRGVEKAYYLAFAGENVKKIAYSTSIGMTSFPEEERDEIRGYLKDYAAISVRESDAVKALREIGIDHAQHVVDPTLALTGDQWRAMASARYAGRKPYVLVYQLNPNREMDAFARKLAQEKQCELLRVHLLYDQALRGEKGAAIPSVPDFISLFANAAYVVTDSFHGTAFCVNLNRQFYVFYPPKYGTRLESILKLTQLENRAVGACGEWADEPIDYARVNPIIAREREKNITFLKEALG